MKILNDFQTSVRKALNEINKKWEKYNGLIVAGTHDQKNADRVIKEIQKAREANIPFLGICGGHQLMLIEYAKNVLGIVNATSEEFDITKEGTHIIKRLPAPMLGIKKVKGNSESHWNYYAFNNAFIDIFEKNNWELYLENGIIEIAELKRNKYHLGVQFHPEYQNLKGNPHYILKEFLKVCQKK